MTQPAVTFDSLRKSVLILDRALGQDGPRALRHLADPLRIWMRQLVRMVGCPDLDALAAALAGLDRLALAVERAHAAKALAGIKRIRAAFGTVEAYIDTVPLAPLGQQPVPDEVLDLPREGVLANVLRRRCLSGSAAAPASGSIQTRGAARPAVVPRSARKRPKNSAVRCAA